MAARPKVVFVCNHNAGKSRMAEAYLRHLAGSSVEVESAGTDPGACENPDAVRVMSELGLTVRAGPGVELTPDMAALADVIVTFGCEVDPGVADDSKVQDWAMVDADGKPLLEYRDVRDEIVRRVDRLAADLRLDEP